jgi:hypothetical protein
MGRAIVLMVSIRLFLVNCGITYIAAKNTVFGSTRRMALERSGHGVRVKQLLLVLRKRNYSRHVRGFGCDATHLTRRQWQDGYSLRIGGCCAFPQRAMRTG